MWDLEKAIPLVSDYVVIVYLPPPPHIIHYPHWILRIPEESVITPHAQCERDKVIGVGVQNNF